MPNVRKRTTNRGLVSAEIMDLAAEEVLRRKVPFRDAANSYQLCHVTLYRYVQKKKKMLEEGLTNSLPNVGYVSKRRIFSDQEEKILAEYLLHCSQINYGMTTKEVRKMAFQLAIKYNKDIPCSWTSNQCAGEDWLRLFMRRNPRLSIRAPQATSIARATSFNRSNVELFFKNYIEVLERENYTASAIWNMDETGITTVQKPDRVIAGRGTKQVSSVTSAERGVLVTVATAVNAIGNSIPPMFIFPRKRFQDHFIRDAPQGSTGSANGSGWMQEEDFYIFLNHFKTHARPSKDNKCILLLDNHNSHIALKNIDLCRDSGIVLLTFPPHCTHKMQPLDRSVFGPLKKAVNACCDNWMRSNPGKVMTIYDIPSIVRDSFPIAVTPRNIQAGFACTGIWPVNTQIFTDVDFLPSSVTDRPLEGAAVQQSDPIPSTSREVETVPSSQSPPIQSASTDDILLILPELSPSPLVTPPLIASPTSLPSPVSPSTLTELTMLPMPDVPPTTNLEIDDAMPSTSFDTLHILSTSSSNIQDTTITSFDPYEVKPLPKAGPRKNNGKGRKGRKTAIMTDTPNKLEVEEQEKRKMRAKAVKKPILQTVKETKKARAVLQKKKKTEKKKKDAKTTEASDDSDGEDCFCLVCMENFSNSRSNEKWVQCLECHLWAHVDCTNNEISYVCHNCLSD
uniref:HTH CENPB-type domain-containing protein n=1 Tax=Heliothis virescens TaxID=7102 RepID=A0A2A4K4E0_HELVI